MINWKETFRDIYANLPTINKQICNIIAVVYEPLNETTITYMATWLGLKDENKTTLNVQKCTNICHNLAQKQLVSYNATTKTYRINHQIEEWVFRIAVEEPYFKALAILLSKPPYQIDPYHNSIVNTFERCIRELRIGLLLDDKIRQDNALNKLNYKYQIEWQDFNFNQRFYTNPIDPQWLNHFNSTTHLNVLNNAFYATINQLKNPTSILQVFNLPAYKTHKDTNIKHAIKDWTAYAYLLQGNFRAAKQDPNMPTYLYYGIAAVVDFLTGNDDKALAEFDEYLKQYRKEKRSRKTVPSNFAALCYVLVLLKKQTPESIAAATDFLSRTTNQAAKLLDTVILLHKNQPLEAQNLIKDKIDQLNGIDEKIIAYYCLHWLDNGALNAYQTQIEQLYQQAINNNYQWIAFELANLLRIINPQNNNYNQNYQQLSQQIAAKSIASCYQRKESWMMALQALSMLNPNESANKNSRLVWHLSFNPYIIVPFEQSVLKSGAWSPGKLVALRYLYYHELECMSQQDHEIARALSEKDEYNNGRTTLEWNYEEAFKAMINHPFLFDGGGNPIELLRKEPELLIDQTENGYQIKFSTEVKEIGVKIVQENPHSYQLIEVTQKHLNVLTAMGAELIDIPLEAKQELTKITTSLSAMVMVNSLLMHENDDIPTVPADQRIYAQLTPRTKGLRAELCVKPFTASPPYATPGKGNVMLMNKTENKLVKTLRNLDAETNNLNEVIDNCPTLQQHNNNTAQWLFEDTQDALNLLTELEPLVTDNKLIIEWPKGETFKIKHRLGFGNLSVKIRQQKDWFDIDGEVKVGNQDIMTMRELLDLIGISKKPFIELTDGSFLMLTQEFHDRLQDLNTYTTKRGNHTRFHKLAAFAIEDFTQHLSHLDTDQHWNNQLEKLNKLQKHQPKLPTTLQADLRQYQIEGFEWMSQMAEWGVGACLADDMGLGKTLQALAVMLERANKGAALVVAPSSVCQNWINEVTRFAPTLNPILFSRTDRQTTINQLKPFDLLVCSYTLMQQEAEMLSKVKWVMVILDEAQAIKNQNTKRSRAAMSLDSEFKLITTGTPIENHLGELWNLFNFINPGLLGSAETFIEKYATPIEKYEDTDRRQQLHRLIKPFVLRRRKSQVLEELPSKTEITLNVELSPTETAFYEAIRQNAVERIEQIKTEGQPTQQLQILTEIMRLRQAACNVQLVNKNLHIPSSKLQLFAETVQELLDNGHKALVFSQFVGHLRLIEQQVKKMGISYQYLDGQTPVHTRQTLVDEFQKGNGDLFLISLKAGGVGLNLTAADYVIIMDPWWNPAVEDQAADRAHRFGQQRPVTIYRLVSQNTIEEKIIQLHNQKRDLADSLLEGTEGSSKLSANELLELMRNE